MAANWAQDEILEERPLLGAAELAAAGLARADEPGPDGSPALLWPADAPPLELVPPFELDRCDEIAIKVFLREGQAATLWLNLELGPQTPGMTGRDRSWSWYPLGAAARSGRAGWQEARFCLEDCHFYGNSLAWTGARSLVLRKSQGPEGALLVSGAVARRRRRPDGPRLSDAGLFAELDLERPELAAVRAAVAQGNLPGAARELCGHYRRREAPRNIYPRPAQPPPAADLDRLLRNDILGCDFAGPVDWRANPFGYLEWRHAFNRHGFFRTALAAYLHSGNEAVASKLDKWVRTWIAATPEPSGTFGGGDPAWETLSTACRIYGSWMDVFFGTLRSPGFSDATRLAMLKSIRSHAGHLLAHSVLGGNNWLVVESQALATIGLLFPEFKSAEVWRREGFARLAAEVGRQIYPDGADWELSPGYHAMAARGFAEPMELARMNGVELPPGYEERIRGTFRFSLGIVRPDFTAPAPNDSGTCDGRQAEWLAYGARLFGDEALAWGATGGAEGRAPEFTSVHFEDSGYAVMRSGWDRDARWLFLDMGPLGFSHVHEDKLSFELAAHGKLFIVDPGIASYQADPWTEHYRRTEAHNTILVDGAGQHRASRGTREEQARSVRGENLWASGRVLDAAASECDGPWRGLAGRLVHRRSALFIKPDYWLMLDEVEGGGEEENSPERDIATLFHFMPMQLAADPETGRVRSERLEQANLEIAPIPTAGSAAPAPHIVCGSREPVQGWVVAGGGRGHSRESLPAPVAVYEAKARLPWRCLWLLVPFRSGTAAGVRTRTLEAAPGCSALECSFPDGRRDLLFVRHGGGGAAAEASGAAFGGFSTDGRMAVVRFGPEGALSAAGAVGATKLAGPGLNLSARTATLLERHD